jgi:HEPN domain-containing protein
MKPHLEEALLSLRLADRDVKAFEVLSKDPEVHQSVACFHAQQAIEKSLKAVLFAIEIEFGRTHDLVKLAQLARNKGIPVPISDGELRKLNPFAVTFRYDDTDIDTIPKAEAADLVAATRAWAEEIVREARKRAEQGGQDNE